MTSYRYPLPRRYRVRYPYRYRKGGSSNRVIGAALGVVLVSGLGAGTATAVHHDAHKPPAAASAPVIVASPGEAGYTAALLAALGAPDTAANASSLAAWISRETPWPPVASWNAMNTTLPMPGSWVFNSVGVQSYPSESEGVQANAATLSGGYPLIVSSLRSGSGLCGNLSLAGEFLTWSGGGYSGVC
jgi:hypothetical protein